MYTQRFAGLAGITLLALGLVLLPITTRSQSGAPAQAPAPRAVAPALPAPPAAQGCDLEDALGAIQDRIAASMEAGERARAEMANKLRGLGEDLARGEAQMKDEDLEKLGELSAALDSQKAAELSAQADELASQVEQLVIQEPEVMVLGEDSGWLGVDIAEVTADKAKELKLAKERGVLVVSVEPDSPAAKAGLKANDVITEYQRQEVEGTAQFRRLVRETPPGRNIPISVWRDGRTQNLSVEIGNRGSMAESRWHHFDAPNFEYQFEMPEFMGALAPSLGISAEDLSGQLGEYFGAPDGEGVLVREVRPGTPAEKAGLKAGDVITKVDGKPVKAISDLREELREKRGQKTVSLSVLRKGSEMNFNVELETPRHIEHPRVTRRITL